MAKAVLGVVQSKELTLYQQSALKASNTTESVPSSGDDDCMAAESLLFRKGISLEEF